MGSPFLSLEAKKYAVVGIRKPGCTPTRTKEVAMARHKKIERKRELDRRRRRRQKRLKQRIREAKAEAKHAKS